MSKFLKIFVLLVLLIVPLSLSYYFRPKHSWDKSQPQQLQKPKVAIVFEDMGTNLGEFRDICSLGIPINLSIVPGLPFSHKIAYLASSANMGVLVHLPLGRYLQGKEPARSVLSAHLSRQEIESLMRGFINFSRNTLGFSVSQLSKNSSGERFLFECVAQSLKNKKFFILERRAGQDSFLPYIAQRYNLGYISSRGFLDVNAKDFEKKLMSLPKHISSENKITVVLLHPQGLTIDVLKKNIDALSKEVEFVSLKEYEYQQ